MSEINKKQNVELCILQKRLYKLLVDEKSGRNKVKLRAFMVLLGILNKTKDYYFDIICVCTLMRGSENIETRCSLVPPIRDQMEFLKFFLDSMSKFVEWCDPDWKISDTSQMINNFMPDKDVLRKVREGNVDSYLRRLKGKCKYRKQYSANSVYNILSKLRVLLENSKLAEPLAVCSKDKFKKYKKYQEVEIFDDEYI